ncbi:MAG: T9SS type A sorting domain-containing protein [Putridiphycobacter sp.]
MKNLLFILTLILTIQTNAQPYTEIDKIIASDRAELARFGQAVALSNNYAVVGAYGAGPYNNGQIYIYEKQGSHWVQTQIIENSDNENYDRFGYSVALDGDYLIVGAPGEDEDETGMNSISKAGSVYIFKNNAGTWTETQKIVASDRSADDEFGWSLDIDGNTLIVGAHQDFEDVNGLNPIHHAGSCYLFDLNTSTEIWTETQKIVASDRAPDLYYPNGYTGEDLSDQFGHTVGISGDYVVVGALNHDYRPDLTSEWQCGSAYIFERSGGIWTEVQQIINSDNVGNIWERFGSDVAIDSNIIVVGMWAQDYTAAGTDYMKNAGAAYIFVRDNMGVWNENQKIVAGMRNSGDHFGWDVKINDGFIISGTEHDDHDENEINPLHEAGSAYIFQMDGSGLFQQIQKIRASDRDSLDVFGYAVDIYGVNAISGAFQHDWNLVQADSMQEAGAAYIYSSVPCPSTSVTQDISICNGQSITVGSSTYSTAGNYVDTLLSTNGCDSIVTTNLTVNTEFNVTNTVSICDGGSYTVGASTYTLTGNYADTLTSSIAGCDSIINTNLTVYPVYSQDEFIEICDGDSYTINGNTYTTTGDYTNIFSSINGCDSTIITHLTVNPSYNISQNVELCNGETVTVGTNTYSSAGTYTDNLTSINGCDSTVITTITLNATNGIEVTQNVTICYNETYQIGGSTYSTPGSYTDTLQMTTSSCDSIVHTNLFVNPPLDLSIDTDNNLLSSNQDNAAYQWVSCDNNYSPILLANQQDYDITSTGSYAVTLNVNGCVDTSACVYIEYVGLKKISDITFDIYPNPSNGVFTIQVSEANLAYAIELIDVSGQVIYVRSNQINQSQIDLELANGIYFINLVSEAGNVMKKIVIQH